MYVHLAGQSDLKRGQERRTNPFLPLRLDSGFLRFLYTQPVHLKQKLKDSKKFIKDFISASQKMHSAALGTLRNGFGSKLSFSFRLSRFD
jgi:hypothetical protein